MSRKPIRRRLTEAAACAAALAFGCTSPQPPAAESEPAAAMPPATEAAEPTPVDPLALVARHLEGNSLGVPASDLRVMDNPRGDGQLVWVERTAYDEGVRHLVWMVLDGEAYAINGQTHKLTPTCQFPRGAGEERWARTGLDPRRATEALEIVFGPP